MVGHKLVSLVGGFFKGVVYSFPFLFRVAFMLIFSFYSHVGFGVKAKFIDSLRHVADTTTNQRAKVEALYGLSYEYSSANPQLGMLYGRQCLQLATQLNDSLYMLCAYNGIGSSFETLGNYDSAAYYHQLSLQIALKSGKAAHQVATLFNVGLCYLELGHYHEALQIYLQAMRLTEEHQETYNPRIYIYLAKIYLKLDEVDKAIPYAKKCLHENVNSPYDYIGYISMSVLAQCYHHFGQTDSALYLLQLAYDSLSQHVDVNSTAYCLNAMAEIFIEIGNYEKAAQSFEKEISLHQQSNNYLGMAIAELNLAYVYAKLKNHSQSSSYFDAALPKVQFIAQNKNSLLLAYFRIAQAAELLGKTALSLDFYKKHYALKDSLTGQENIRLIRELESKYELEKKERTIALQEFELQNQRLLLTKRSTQLALSALLFIMLLLSILLIYNRRKEKEKISHLKALQAIELSKELAIVEKENEERMRIAKNIHDELGSGISKIYLLAEGSLSMPQEQSKTIEHLKSISKTAKFINENMRDLVWSLDPENNTTAILTSRILEYSHEFLEGLNISFYDDSAPIHSAVGISKEAMRNLFLVYKEALNNVVKHAQATEVRLTMALIENKFSFTLQDNGRGFKVDEIRKTANGLKNMSARMQEIGGQFLIENKPVGTSVTAFISLKS